VPAHAGRKLQLAASSTPRLSRGAVAVEANIFGRVSRVFRSYMNAIGAHRRVWHRLALFAYGAWCLTWAFAW
jgi:hypothetical protein